MSVESVVSAGTLDARPVSIPVARSPQVGRPSIPLRGTRSGLAGQALVLLFDALSLTAVLSLAVGIYAGLGGGWPLALYGPLVMMASALMAAFLAGRVYAAVRRHPVAEFRQTCLAIIGLGAMAAVASTWATDRHWTATLTIVAVSFVLLFAIPITRYVSRHSGARLSWWGRRVVIVGGGETGVRLYHLLQKRAHLGLRPVGILEDLDELSLDAEPASYLGPVSELPRVAEDYGVSLGILVAHEGSGKSLDLLHEGSVLPDWMLLTSPAAWPSLWAESRELGGMPSLSVRNHLRLASAQRLKRAMDVVLVVVGGILLLPVLALIALAVKISSPGPIFFAQDRTGYNGKRFRAWKFRSMRVDAEAVLRKYLAEHPELQREWNAIRKLKNDPRTTGIGKLLRKTSLDELPQLWNVLIGEMSLVGPRPLPDTDLDKYDQMDVYTKALPGITGLWQISGRSNTTFEERVAYDAFYVRNWSPWFDLYILACTVRVVLIGEGAY